MKNFEWICPVCGKEMAEVFPTGERYCPTCEGREMARKVSEKVKLNLNLEASNE